MVHVISFYCLHPRNLLCVLFVLLVIINLHVKIIVLLFQFHVGSNTTTSCNIDSPNGFDECKIVAPNLYLVIVRDTIIPLNCNENAVS